MNKEIVYSGVSQPIIVTFLRTLVGMFKIVVLMSLLKENVRGKEGVVKKMVNLCKITNKLMKMVSV